MVTLFVLMRSMPLQPLSRQVRRERDDLPCDSRVRVLLDSVVDRRLPVSDFRLTPDMIGMNNYEYYDPDWCDGHYCCRDCEKCNIADEMMEAKADEGV